MTNPITRIPKLYTFIHYSIALIAMMISVWLVYTYIMHTWVIWDGSFYLLMARLFYENGNIYNDMPSAYTPLGAMIYSIPLHFSTEPSYKVFLIIQHFFILLSGILVYRMLLGKLNRGLALATASVFILIILALDTKDVKLDAIYFFFLLAAYYIMVNAKARKAYIFTGVFFALAWLTKQFALLAFPPIIIYLWMAEKTMPVTYRFQYFFIGILIVITLFYLYFVFYAGVPFIRFTRIIMAIQDNTDYGGTGLTYSIQQVLIRSFKNMIYLIPFIIPAISWFLFSMWKGKNWFSNAFILLFFLSGFFFMPKLALGHYDNYFKPIIGFFFIFLVLQAGTLSTLGQFLPGDRAKSVFKGYHYLIFLFLVFAPPLVHGSRTLSYHIGNKENHIQANTSYIESAEKINRIVPYDSPAIVDGNEAFVFLCRLKPANPQELPAGFARNYKGVTIQQNMLPGAYLIIKENRLGRYTIYFDNNFKFLGRTGDHLIFQKVGECN